MSPPTLPTGPGEQRHPASFSAGVFFVLAGIVFLLEWLDVFQLLAVLWPLLLICLGVAVAAEGVLLWLGRPANR